MTTSDSEIEDGIEDVAEIVAQVVEEPKEAEEPEEPEEPENPLFHVSVERLGQLDRSAVHLIAGRLSAGSPSKSKPVHELGDVRALIREVAKGSKNDPEYIRSDMPLQEIVFRTLLAGGNKPISLFDLHEELTEKWATPIRPIVITEERLLRVLDTDSYYGFARV